MRIRRVDPKPAKPTTPTPVGDATDDPLLDLPLGEDEDDSLGFAPPGEGTATHTDPVVVAASAWSTRSIVLVICIAMAIAAAVAWMVKPAPPVAVLEAVLTDFGTVRLGDDAMSRTIELVNRGQRKLTLEGVALSGDAPDAFVADGAGCTAMPLAPGETCSVRVAYAPTGVGTQRAMLDIVSDALNGPTRAALIGRAVAPVVRLEPAEVRFDPTPMTRASKVAVVTLTNTGDAPLGIDGLALDGLASADFVARDDRCSGTTLEPAARCSYELRFLPTAVGTRNARLVVRGDLPPGVEPMASLTGEGLQPTPRLELGASAIDFGAQPAGQLSPMASLPLRNTGTADLVISAVTLVPSTAPFALDASACTDQPLPPDEPCQIDVRALPTGEGDVEAELELAYGDERVTVPVRVGGTVPGVDVTPARLSLGNVVVNGEIVATAVRLTNSGQAPLRVEGSRLEGSDARHFQIDGDGCAGATLRPTESCRVDISFDPARAGEHRAALRLAHNAGGGETRVPLGGIGIAPKIEVGRSRVTFPSLMVGEAVEQRLEIRNTGRAPLRIGRMRITGGEAADFALDGACAGAILAPGKRCSTGVRFAPSAPGDRRSELIVEHDATDSPLRLAVRGEATPPPVARIRTEPRRLDFAALMVGNRGDIATVVIQNPGTGPLELLGIRIRGAAARDFTVVPGSCDAAFRVDPGASCTVGVRFAPTEGGARDAELEIRHNASDAVYVVALSGRGLTPTPPVPPPTGEGGSTSNR